MIFRGQKSRSQSSGKKYAITDKTVFTIGGNTFPLSAKNWHT